VAFTLRAPYGAAGGRGREGEGGKGEEKGEAAARHRKGPRVRVMTFAIAYRSPGPKGEKRRRGAHEV